MSSRANHCLLLGLSGPSAASPLRSPFDPFRKKQLAAIVHHMFDIFHGDVLIGRSELESGDPPMSVASGLFEPTEVFAPLRNTMKPAGDGVGKEQRDARYLVGVCARTADGITLVCSSVEVWEYGETYNPLAWEVFCLGIEQPPYDELFSHHVKAGSKASTSSLALRSASATASMTKRGPSSWRDL
jgi:hypothetical protein